MSIIHSISIFFQIITFEIDGIVDSYEVVIYPLANVRCTDVTIASMQFLLLMGRQLIMTIRYLTILYV